ncbi:MAG: outer membrane beta-barrel protein [Flavobacteriales bacterium]|nr:outer membrane beta-barrel protein [Flavobacteriales bacterium]
MKKITLGLAAFAFAGGLMAQSNQISLGVDLAMPLGDFGDAYGLGVGPTAGFELPIGDNLGVTLQVSYDILMPKSEVKDFIKSASMLPAQLGLKYYFQDQQEGFYGHAQLGIHSVSTKSEEITTPGVPALGIPDRVTPSQTTSSTNFSWAIGVGYQLEKLDLGLRYNSISPDSDVDGAKASSYIGLRVAYLISLN